MHASPEWTELHIEAERETALAMLLIAFWKAVGLPPQPADFSVAHRWRYAMPAAPTSEYCFVDYDKRVAVCGDWCGGSNVEAAYLSGIRVAETIVAQP